nr:molybdopterin-dependent oxidoreductase [Acidimicrobiia bacterium]
SYVEVTAPIGLHVEYGAVEVHDDGTASLFVGTSTHGQGHHTAFAMLVSDQTGIPVPDVRVLDGDTATVPKGGGTGGSRSLQLGGSAVHQATETMVERARALAAHLLEADVSDVVVDTERGTVGVAGVPASALSWGELAARADEAPNDLLPDGVLGAAGDFDQGDATFPFGTHIAVVEVDLDTGHVRLVRHVAVDDCGRVLNPLLVEGQQHGGVAAGAGQALLEEVRYDDAGNPMTSTLADYGIATAAELPLFEVHSTETPTPLNPLGAKGIGEAATIGATPAVQNAVIDAVAHLGVRHIDMPCTAERVWRTIRHAEAGTLPDPWRDPPAIFATLAAAAHAATATEGDGVSATESI